MSGESGYIDLIRRIIYTGEERTTRNAKVYSVFGATLTFDMSNGTIPIITTKKVSFKNVFHELMFFLCGITDTKYLEQRGVNIWKGNTTREFLDQRGLFDYREGVIGPGYGFQWNHFGAEYKGPDYDYTNEGINQIDECIDTIRNDPTSRRILFSSWNPVDFGRMALPPCHIMFQFYVRNVNGVKYLDGQLYQRSADVMLGVPYNILSYSLLLYMVAKVTDLKVGKLHMCFGDVHIYDNHMDGAREQIGRTPYAFPKFEINGVKSIREYTIEDMCMCEYQCYPNIKMKMIA